ncbi:MAG: glycosyltransferase family 4 protein [Micrococcaceae bacterium]
MKKVIIATRIYAPEPAAAAFRLRSLARGFVTLGASAEVITTTFDPTQDSSVKDSGVKVDRKKALRNKQGNIKGYVNYMSFDLPLFKRLLSADTPDVYVSEPPATTAVVVNTIAKMRKRPWAYYAADVWSAAAKSFGAPSPVVLSLEKLEKTMLNSSDLVLTVSEAMSERLQKIGVKKEKISIVGNGVDTSIFNMDAPAIEDPLMEKPYFAYAGTLSAWQGIDVFIEAMPKVMEKYPDINFVILGQGDHEEKLRKIAQEKAPNNVHFLGVKAGPEAASWISHSKAALASVDPSQGYTVAQPTKTFAASACGTPVIYAGNDVGSKLVTDEKLGVAVDYDADSAAQAMIDMLDNPWENRAELSNWANENASLEKIGLKAAELVLALTEKN